MFWLWKILLFLAESALFVGATESLALCIHNIYNLTIPIFVDVSMMIKLRVLHQSNIDVQRKKYQYTRFVIKYLRLSVVTLDTKNASLIKKNHKKTSVGLQNFSS